MEAATVLRLARKKSGLSLRKLARRAETSHATLSAYEAGRTVPSVATMDRIVTAAGFNLQGTLEPRVVGPLNHGSIDAPRMDTALDWRAARGKELMDVLELASLFPARHSPTLEAPVFRQTSLVRSR
ncbi:MAG: helix-turn-helix transcriptional regulator [Microthrixaceae bacterium]